VARPPTRVVCIPGWYPALQARTARKAGALDAMPLQAGMGGCADDTGMNSGKTRLPSLIRSF